MNRLECFSSLSNTSLPFVSDDITKARNKNLCAKEEEDNVIIILPRNATYRGPVVFNLRSAAPWGSAKYL